MKDYAELEKRLRSLREVEGPTGAHMIPALEAIVADWRARCVNEPEDAAHAQVEAYDLALHCIRAEVVRKERAELIAAEAADAIKALLGVLRRAKEALQPFAEANPECNVTLRTASMFESCDLSAEEFDTAARVFITLINYTEPALLSREPSK